MHEARRGGRRGGDSRRELVDERYRQRARVSRLAGERARVERFAPGHLVDRPCLVGRDESRARARQGQRAFEARHGRQQLLVAERVSAALVRENEVETQKSKNTVSPLPCSTTFHSSTPSLLLRATSVGRRSAGTRPRTGSSALAGSSGK